MSKEPRRNPYLVAKVVNMGEENMLKSAVDFLGWSIHASDGEIGHVDDLYFDDETWTVRYAVVNCGNWLTGRRVLLSPGALSGPADYIGRRFPVSLNRDQIKHSPDIDTHKPVSRQQEEELFAYYSWPAYWPPLAVAGDESTVGLPGQLLKTTINKEDLHLRSLKVVKKYSIHATDGAIGHLTDFIVQEATWKVRYLVVDAGRWLTGRRILVAVAWMDHISWLESTIFVALTKQQVKNSPQIGELMPNHSYEKELHEHYQKPGYWQ
ncbi:MAG: PRC-barrel domain-containing protein [Candidatus Omnitrophica bacterium]|nr:PRC-barrel domain-containing protein [Candidatus Omnitrophota bacterium]